MLIAEAEYIGEAQAALESRFLGPLLQELGYEGKDIEIVVLRVDNQAAIKMVMNSINHPRTKHIDSAYHVVREIVVETGLLTIEYVPTSEILADGLTKPLEKAKF